jgi:6-phosphogluconolactonase
MTSWVFVGSQTRWKEKPGKGIYSCCFDKTNAALTIANLFLDIENPTFLAVFKNYLYAVIEVDDWEGKSAGAIAAFSMDAATGKLTLLNRRSTKGAHPCYIGIDKTGRALFVSNYTGGSVAVFSIESDGSLGECSQLITYQGASVHPNQTSSHAHSAIVSPDNRYVFVQDLGTDIIQTYRLSLQNNHPQLIEKQPAIHLEPGAGPRHFIFHPIQPTAYLMNELNSTVAVFDYEPAEGRLTQKQIISSLPDDFSGENSAADIHITHNGRFLYASNRGHDSLAIFCVDEKTGELTTLGHHSTLGKHPRHFVISPDDRFLLCANRSSDNIVSFYIDAATGLLTSIDQNQDCHKPVCVVFAA